jgi:ATP-dependent protease HslVU (ClpYQ) peptidase subunit
VLPALSPLDGRVVPLMSKMEGEFEVMVLSSHGLWIIGSDGTPLQVEDEFYTIGTGAPYASACLRTQELTCTAYNLQMALEVACEYDDNSRLPAVELKLGKK